MIVAALIPCYFALFAVYAWCDLGTVIREQQLDELWSDE